MRTLIAIALLCLTCTLVQAQGTTISVPMTFSVTIPPPPPPPPIVVAVSQPMTINGVIYRVTGTLTFTPTTTTGSLPAGGGNPVPPSLSALPDGNVGTTIAGFKDKDGHWATVFAPGDTLYIEGHGFDQEGGEVVINNEPADVFEWWNGEEIGTVIPPAPNTTTRWMVVYVKNSKGEYTQSKGFTLSAKP